MGSRRAVKGRRNLIRFQQLTKRTVVFCFEKARQMA